MSLMRRLLWEVCGPTRVLCESHYIVAQDCTLSHSAPPDSVTAVLESIQGIRKAPENISGETTTILGGTLRRWKSRYAVFPSTGQNMVDDGDGCDQAESTITEEAENRHDRGGGKWPLTGDQLAGRAYAR